MSAIQGTRAEGLTNIHENIDYTFEAVECIVNQKQNHTNGTLYLTHDNLVFVSGAEEDYSIVLDYQSIGVHAVTHETLIWNRPCIYCQISQPGEGDDEEFNIVCGETSFDAVGEEEVEEEEEEDGSVFELLISPIDSTKIDSLFDAISHMQILHPDPIKEEDVQDDGRFMTANGWVSVEDHVCSLFDQAAMEYEANQE